MAGESDRSQLSEQHFGQAFKTIEQIQKSLERSVVGQAHLRRRLITALMTRGHILLEGVPGLAKTLSIKALATSVNGVFRRIQFTPDLLPADLIGTEIFRPQDGKFEVRKGPVFANFVLADEINRAPAKVQSALLETMQEHQVTIGQQSFSVPEPFFVMATQNPIEQEGTYPLPEAQVDRFLMKIKVGYPSVDEEQSMLNLLDAKNRAGDSNVRETLPPVCTLEHITAIQRLCDHIYVDDKIKRYIVDLAWATREPTKYGLKLKPLIELGASPRASIALLATARAEALFSGEQFVVPQNVKDVAFDVLRHRILISYEAEAQGLTSDDIIRMVLDGVQVP